MTRRLQPQRAASYRRESGQGQKNNYSLKTQGQGIQRYCREHNYIMNNDQDYTDIKTGIVYREREALNVLRAAARRHEFDVVVVYDLDRFSRNPVQQMVVIEDLINHGVRVECVLRTIDYSPEGQLTLFSQGYAAQLEHERILERISRGQRARVEDGKPLAGGNPRYGYQWANKEKTRYELSSKVVYIDKNGTQWKEGDVAAYIFDLADSGYSLNRIANALSEAQIPTPKGNDTWAATTIRRILEDPIYTGRPLAFKWEVERDAAYTRIVKHRAPEKQIPLPIDIAPALVDIEKFERVQRQIQANKERSARNTSNQEDALLQGGLVICGYCGVNMSVSRYNGYAVYMCTMGRKGYGTQECKFLSTSARKLDDALWQRAAEIIQNPSLVRQAITKRRQLDITGQDLIPINNLLIKIQRQMKNYNLAIGSTENDDVLDALIGDLNKLAKIANELKKMRDDLMVEHDAWEQSENALDEFEGWRANFRGGSVAPTYQEKRNACEILGLKAYVWKATHSPHYAIEDNL